MHLWLIAMTLSVCFVAAGVGDGGGLVGAKSF